MSQESNEADELPSRATLAKSDDELSADELAAQRSAVEQKLAALSNPTKARARRQLRQWNSRRARKSSEGNPHDARALAHEDAALNDDQTATGGSKRERHRIRLAVNKLRPNGNKDRDDHDEIQPRDFANLPTSRPGPSDVSPLSSASYLELSAQGSRETLDRASSSTSNGTFPSFTRPGSVDSRELVKANASEQVLLAISAAPTAEELAHRPSRTDTMRGQVARRTTTLTKAVRHAAEQQRHHLRLNRKVRKPGRPHDGEQEQEDLLIDALLRAGLLEKEIAEAFETDVLWENQRGLSLLGPHFGSQALGPLDPSQWTDKKGQDSPYSISNYPLPTPAWSWHHSQWLVNMAGDVDSEGWMYSTRFSSKFWRGVPDLRFFVRRRLWIRSRYRPHIKAQEISSLANREGQASQLTTTPSSSSKASPIPDTLLSHPLSAVEAAQLNPYNPFLSWYTYKASHTDPAEYKEDFVHANFVRAAKVLVRRTGVDRERLGWWEWWLGTRTDRIERPQQYADESDEAVLSERDESSRPDIKDVWDLLEAKLDDLLQFFEYQESRRRLLTILMTLHNETHPGHRYRNRSDEPLGPDELEPLHMHGSSGDSNVERDTTEYTPLPRLAFWSDVEKRLREINVAMGKPRGADTETSPTRNR